MATGKFLAGWTVAAAALVLTAPNLDCGQFSWISRQRRNRPRLSDELLDGGKLRRHGGGAVRTGGQSGRGVSC